MKNWSDHVGIMLAILVLISQTQEASPSLFAKYFEHKVHNSISDPNGNFLLLDLTVHNNRFTLASIYGTNTDSPDFFFLNIIRKNS